MMLIEQWDTLKANYGKFRPELSLDKQRPHEIPHFVKFTHIFGVMEA